MTTTTLTVVSVLGPHDGTYWELNCDLLAELSPHISFSCHLVDNYATLSSNPKLPTVVHRRSDLMYDSMTATRGSIEHSRCLNFLLSSLGPESGLVLIIDPDFFVVDGKHLAKFIDQIASGECAILGSTWHQRWTTKSQKWLAPHFILFDASRIDPTSLDFSTGFALNERDLSRTHESKTRRHGIEMLYSMTLGRLRRGSSPDTGYMVAKQVQQDGHKLRLLKPRRQRRPPRSLIERQRAFHSSTMNHHDLFNLLRGSEFFEDCEGLWGIHLRKQVRTVAAPSATTVRQFMRNHTSAHRFT